MTDEDRAPPTFGSIEQQNSSIFCLNSFLLWDEVEVPTILNSGTSGQNKALPPPGSVCTESGYCYYPRSKNDFAHKFGGWVGLLRLFYLSLWVEADIRKAVDIKKTIEDVETKKVHLRKDPEWITKRDSTIRTIDEETNARRAKFKTIKRDELVLLNDKKTKAKQTQFETIGRDEAKENLNALQGEGDTQDLSLDKSMTAERRSSGHEDMRTKS